MIPDSIVKLMRQQPGDVWRSASETSTVLVELKRLGLTVDSEPGQFFQKFNLTGVLSTRDLELLDLCTPTPQISMATEFGRDIYGVGESFICLTSGEDEGFVMLQRDSGAVFDVGVGELVALEAGRIEPGWPTFFALLEWYLDR